MINDLSIIFAIFTIIINSVIFGSVSRNTKNNKPKKAYLMFLIFIILYTIFDCIIIQAFNLQEQKNVIIKLQAVFWMPLSILFLNFTYSLLSKKRDNIFYFFIGSITLSIMITLLSNKVLLSYKGFNFGTMAFTGPWFLPTTFLGIIPAAIYSLYLIGKEANIFYFNNKDNKNKAPFVLLQLKILFFGSLVCLIIAVTTNIFFDEVLGYSGELHLASLSLSIQSLFLLPAIIKYNFLNQPMETFGDELYLNSSDAVLITNEQGIILNLNKSARKLFNLVGPIVSMNITKLFRSSYDFSSKNQNEEVKTRTGHFVTIAQNSIKRGNLSLGKIVVIRNITMRKKIERDLLHTAQELIIAQDVAGLGSFKYDIKKDKVAWSDKLYQIYGRNKKTFTPTSEIFYNEIVHPDSRKTVIEKVDGAINNKLKTLDYVHKALLPGGKEKWFRAIIKISYNPQGEPTTMDGTSQDVTELYSTRILLEESELRLKKAQEIAKLGRWEENHLTGEIYWSSILRKMFNIDLDIPIKQKIFWSMIHPEDRGRMRKNWGKAEKEKTPYSGTFRIKLKNGKIKHLLEHAEFNTNLKGKLIKTVGTVIDMTELHQYQEQLRKLSSHIQNVQEEERSRIASEIHDALGQRLTSMSMDLAFLKSKIGENRPTEVIERLKALSELTEETINITRKISQELRPSILDDLGLISAIDWLKEQYNQRTDIHFTMDMPKNDIEIKDEYATAVFRITQEALTNIMRHAEAQNVNIQIKLENSEILLKIQDDGRGILKKRPAQEPTFGVFGMKERANSLGGELIISSNAKKGTSVKLILPYTQKQIGVT